MNKTSPGALLFAMLATVAVTAPAIAQTSHTPASHVQIAADGGAADRESHAIASEPLTWSVFRVTVSPRGDIQGIRLVYHAANAAFNRAALQAVAQTTFVTTHPTSKPATFDYMLIAQGRSHRARIIGHVPGDQETSLVPNIHVPPSGAAWLANYAKV